MTYQHEFVMMLNAEYETHLEFTVCAVVFRFLAREAYIIRTRQLRSLRVRFFEPHVLGNPPAWLHTAHTVNSNGFSHSAFHFLTNSC